MVFSKKQFFNVTILNDTTNTEYKEHVPLEKDVAPYIIGEKGKSFIIKMSVNASKTDDSEVYGSKLYIDGEEVKGIKTFRKYGRYFGFKCGNGVYKKFLFGAPCYDNSERGGNKDIGKIKIIFFTTQEIRTGRRQSRFNPAPYIPRQEKYLDSNKKLCFKSLQVVEGQTFDNGHTTRQRLKYQRGDRDQRVQHVVDFQDDIDDIELSYSDFYGIIALGMISTSNLNHLRYIPTTTLDYTACGNALNLIIDQKKSSDNRMGLRDLKDQFLAICEHDLASYYENNEISSLDNLIKVKYNHRFEIIDDEYIIQKDISNRNKIEVKLRNDNNLLQKDYVLTGNQLKMIDERNMQRSYRKTNNNANDDTGTSMKIETGDPSDFVDLTEDEIIYHP
jgi:hypothetical protein